MCLTVTHFHIKIATEDIPCYKDLDDKGMTPFMGVPFTETPLENIEVNWGIPYITGIRKGFIHAFRKCPGYVIEWRKYYGKLNPPKYNAYIPKGTKYWEGFFGEYKCYAAKCIKLYNNPSL